MKKLFLILLTTFLFVGAADSDPITLFRTQIL
jgi:uncharacterized protein YcfL